MRQQEKSPGSLWLMVLPRKAPPHGKWKAPKSKETHPKSTFSLRWPEKEPSWCLDDIPENAKPGEMNPGLSLTSSPYSKAHDNQLETPYFAI